MATTGDEFYEARMSIDNKEKARRERIATAIASAIVQSPALDHFDGVHDELRIAQNAVRIADALIARLDKAHP